MEKTKKADLTVKQAKWLKAYIETGNATEAAMMSYDTTDRVVAATIGYQNVRKLQIDDLMEEMGLTDVALINIGSEGMTKSVKQSITGEVYPDYGVRHRYWETMLKLKKKLDRKEDNNGNTINLITFRYPEGLNSSRRGGFATSTDGLERPHEIQGVSLAQEG